MVQTIHMTINTMSPATRVVSRAKGGAAPAATKTTDILMVGRAEPKPIPKVAARNSASKRTGHVAGRHGRKRASPKSNWAG